MLREEIGSRLLTVIIWLAIVSLLRLFAGQWDWSWLLFWLGAGWGTFLVDLDGLLDRLIKNFPTAVNQEIKSLWQKKQYQKAYNWFLDSQQQEAKLPFRSALFQTVLVIFCFWALTSTGNWFGKGLVMALLLQLTRESGKLILKNKNQFLHQRLFDIFKEPVPVKAEKWWVVGLALSFLALNLLLI